MREEQILSQPVTQAGGNVEKSADRNFTLCQRGNLTFHIHVCTSKARRNGQVPQDRK